MDQKFAIDKRVLDEAEIKYSIGYLQAIVNIYDELWNENPRILMENFNEDQITLLFYGVLCNQVQNGGFLQLIFNGYAPYVFSEPMIDGLRSWGAVATADLLASIADRGLQVDGEMDKTSLESLSKSYDRYPEFKKHDQDFYANDGLQEVKDHVRGRLSDFVLVV